MLHGRDIARAIGRRAWRRSCEAAVIDGTPVGRGLERQAESISL
jgi:hypothetical protein